MIHRTNIKHFYTEKLWMMKILDMTSSIVESKYTIIQLKKNLTKTADVIRINQKLVMFLTNI